VGGEIVSKFGDRIDTLSATIASRKDADPASSWSAKLLADPELAAKKLAEEAVELALAAVAGRTESVIAESADLIYHWLALIAGAGVSLDAVADALAAREGRSGVAEKAARE
jgi:phosphoribosyl-ATP pyrophosphohydrolase